LIVSHLHHLVGGPAEKYQILFCVTPVAIPCHPDKPVQKTRTHLERRGFNRV
jgi:hypothetical protein